MKVTVGQEEKAGNNEKKRLITVEQNTQKEQIKKKLNGSFSVFSLSVVPVCSLFLSVSAVEL